MMETFAMYLLKSVIWLSGFTLVYIIFLRNERFFFLNRLYLISGIVSSILLPFVTVHYSVSLPVVMNDQTVSVVATGIQDVSNTSTPDIRFLLLTLYLAGISFVVFMILKQSRSVIRAIKKADVITSYPVKLVRTSDYTTSFSFFSYVFVNPSITETEMREIMNHEMVHIRQKHWFDLVLVELLCILQWFNPLTWLYVRFIRQNHEYLADEVALQRTSDPAIYKAILLNQIVGVPVVSLANSFNYSLNKKRFNMMKNIISSPYRKMKLLFILPVFAIVFYSFAEPEYSTINADENSGNISSASMLQTKEVKGTVVVQQDGTPLPGASVVVMGTNTGTSTDVNGYFRLNKISEESSLVISFVGYKTKVMKPVFTSDMTVKMVRDTVNLGSVSTMPPPPPPPDAKGAGAPPPPPVPVPSQKSNVNTDVNVSETWVIVEEIPSFPGGNEAMQSFISDNLKYPGEAVKNNITGQVQVSFVVTSSGKIKDVKAIKSINPLLDAEAIRVVSSMPDWKPGTQAGKRVPVDMQLPINFTLK